MKACFVALLVTIAVPMPLAQGDTRETECRAHLGRLGSAIRAYRMIHDGKHPAALSDLYYEGMVDRLSDFVCPVSGTMINVAADIEAKTDYAIGRAASGAEALVQERVARHQGNQVLALFADGTVRLIRADAPAGAGMPPAPTVSAPQPSAPPAASTAASPSASAPVPNQRAGLVLQAAWIGVDGDFVGRGETQSDGAVDGHFRLQTSFPSWREVVHIALRSVENPQSVWHTRESSLWILGVAEGGARMNARHSPSLGRFNGPAVFDLYAADSGGAFAPGRTFTIEVALDAGEMLTTRVSIPSSTAAASASSAVSTGVPATPATPPPPRPGDLTGEWYAGLMVYDIVQTGNTFTWKMRGAEEYGEGTISGDDLKVRWTGGGSANGKIIQKTATGVPTQIGWDNGVGFTRSMKASVTAAPTPPSPTDLTGQWYMGTVLYEIVQTGGTFKWTAPGEVGQGTISGDSLQVTWTGGGAATGKIVERSPSGTPLRILWSNGVVFVRKTS